MISNYGFFWFCFWRLINNRRIKRGAAWTPSTAEVEIGLLASAFERTNRTAHAASVELDAFIKALPRIVIAVLLWLVDLSESGHKPHHADQEHGQQTMITFGLVWFGLVWFGLVWFGLTCIPPIITFYTGKILLSSADVENVKSTLIVRFLSTLIVRF